MFLLLTLNCLDILLGWFQFEQINTGSVFMSSKQAKSLILKQINLQQRLYTNLQEVSQTACKLTTRHTKHGKSCPRVLLRSYMPPGWNAFYFYLFWIKIQISILVLIVAIVSVLSEHPGERFQMEPQQDDLTCSYKSLYRKWSFPLRIYSVTMTKSAVSCGFVTFTEEILNGKLHFLCSEFQNCYLSLMNPVSSIYWQVARELIF